MVRSGHLPHGSVLSISKNHILLSRLLPFSLLLSYLCSIQDVLYLFTCPKRRKTGRWRRLLQLSLLTCFSVFNNSTSDTSFSPRRRLLLRDRETGWNRDTQTDMVRFTFINSSSVLHNLLKIHERG